MERNVSINIGDWSEDGHGRTEVVRLVLRGADLSDQALNASYSRMKELVGFTPEDICNRYESNTIDMDSFERLVSQGFSPDPAKAERNGDYKIINVENSQDYNNDFSMTQLIMFFVGHNIENFSWDYSPKEDVLMGGYNTIIQTNKISTSVGYGMFYG